MNLLKEMCRRVWKWKVQFPCFPLLVPIKVMCGFVTFLLRDFLFHVELGASLHVFQVQGVLCPGLHDRCWGLFCYRNTQHLYCSFLMFWCYSLEHFLRLFSFIFNELFALLKKLQWSQSREVASVVMVLNCVWDCGCDLIAIMISCNELKKNFYVTVTVMNMNCNGCHLFCYCTSCSRSLFQYNP